MEMAAAQISVAISVIAATSLLIIALRVMNWVWLRPKRLEKHLRELGFHGRPYRLLRGDMLDFVAMAKENKTKQIKLSDDVSRHALPYNHHIIKKYGKKSFMWVATRPSIQIVDPEQIKEIMSNPSLFHKVPTPLGEMITGGILMAEGEIWAKHRKILNPAFHLEKVKNMVAAIHLSCAQMVNKWETLVSATGLAEVDVWPYLEDFSGDVISRAAFGSNYEEGRRIFLLQKEQVDLALELFKLFFIPGWKYLPTKASKRMNKVCDELEVLLNGIVNKRVKAMKTGEVNNDDLLGIMLESNSKEIKEDRTGMTVNEVIKECKLFYFAGSETTSNLLVWIMVLLSVHPEWQVRAREEVLQAFGSNKPDVDGLSHLKIVTMIIHEVLRLYPPASMLTRWIPKDTKLGNTNLPAGVEFTLPVILLHYDQEIWGKDSHEFKPERFSEGVSGATKGNLFSYIPFGGGPRICIGQNFAMIEVKMALAMILQRFWFELSASYVHSPFPIFTLQPRNGASLVLHKL